MEEKQNTGKGSSPDADILRRAAEVLGNVGNRSMTGKGTRSFGAAPVLSGLRQGFHDSSVLPLAGGSPEFTNTQAPPRGIPRVLEGVGFLATAATVPAPGPTSVSTDLSTLGGESSLRTAGLEIRDPGDSDGKPPAVKIELKDVREVPPSSTKPSDEDPVGFDSAMKAIGAQRF